MNRPKALNALSSTLISELNEVLNNYEANKDIGAIVITGSEKAFAGMFPYPSPLYLLPYSLLTNTPQAGADIKEMEPLTFSSAYAQNFISPWSHLANNIRKPVIASVSGYALGGGCELALMCDILHCTSTASFGQPEIKLGVIPGAGASQRLTRAIGKSKAMEIILTGKMFSGKEAGEWGIASQVIEGGKDQLVEKSIETAEKISSFSRIAVLAGKESVNKSQELPLREGVEYERRLFHSLFGTQDQKIGKFPLLFSPFRRELVLMIS